MSQLIQNRIFTHTIEGVQEDFKSVPGGDFNQESSDVNFSVKIVSKKGNNLIFKFYFNNLPKPSPFWAILSIQIQDQEFKIFINDVMGRPFKEPYPTPFERHILLNGSVTITYKMTQIPSYICQLQNNHECICYMNSSIQLLFHLAKFRSFLFGIRNEDDESWLFQLSKLFEIMCSYKSGLSTEYLTESFGWPSLARKIPHDAAEFIQIILDHIRSSEYLEQKDQKLFDTIFTSHVINDGQESFQYMINSSFINDESNFKETLESDLVKIKYKKYPEVLFITVSNLPYSDLKSNQKLDLSKHAAEGADMKHSKYTLSGIIIRINKNNQISHYVCYVRAHRDELWIYFSDTVQIPYPWTYDDKKKMNVSPIDSDIKESIDKQNYQTQVLMYVADDVIDEYFCYTQGIIPVQTLPKKTELFNGDTRIIMITNTDDIERYVKEGYTDFENIGSSLQFMIESKLPYSAVYDRVSELLSVPIGSFVLRTESKTGAPFFHRFENNPKRFLKNIHSEKIHLYYEDVDAGQAKSNDYKSIPFYFLYFKFNPNKMLHNINDNLTHSTSNMKNLLKSAPMNTRIKRIPQRTKSETATKIEKKKIKTDQKEEKRILEKNSFHFLTSLVLNTEGKFETILPKLLEIINERDTVKHTQINLYTAQYAENEKEKIGYKRIDTSRSIRQCVQQIMFGSYIYVQCVDNFTDDNLNIDKRMKTEVNLKFLFFKHAKEASIKSLNPIDLFPREISNVFMLERFSLPVTFVKLSDPSKTKTMLFPLKLNLKEIDDIKKIICVAMNEQYPENGLMQLFFSFRKDSPPFHEPFFGKTNIKAIFSILEFAMKTNSFIPLTLNFSGSTSQSFENLNSQEQEREQQEESESDSQEQEPESDTSYVTPIFIHYHIFDKYDCKTQKPVRIYFSENAITNNLTTQVLVDNETSVLDIAKRLTEIFPEGLSEIDKNNLLEIKNDEDGTKLTSIYRIIQISDGKISRELPLSYKVTSNMEIRFERIPDYKAKYSSSVDDELAGFIPVFYGARYTTKYSTNYIGSIGTPFYFPVMKSDIDDYNVQNICKFKKSKLYERLKYIIGEKEIKYNLYVVNYSGFIQDVAVNDLEEIMEKKLNYSICFKDLNASTFIDEIQFFTTEIRLLRET